MKLSGSDAANGDVDELMTASCCAEAQASLRYWWMKAMAMLPSPTAAASLPETEDDVAPHEWNARSPTTA